MRRVALLALLAPLTGLVLAPPVRAADEAELQDLRKAIEARRDRVAGFERKERGLLETLEAPDESPALLAP